MRRGFEVFDKYLHNDKTRHNYVFYANKFFERMNIDYDILQKKPKEIETVVDDYLTWLVTNINPNSIRTQFNPVKFYFEMNDILLNWRKLMKRIPPLNKRSGAETWKDEDLRKMLTVSKDERDRALLTMFLSAGPRIGAIADLKLGHIVDFKDGCKLIKFYENDHEEYPGLLTPEASQYYDDYLEYRKKRGEKLNPSSPAFASVQWPFRPLGKWGIYSIFDRIFEDTHSKTRVRLGNGRYDHYNISMTHGFRKWFDTKIKSIDGVNYNLAEKMFGHYSKTHPQDTTYLVSNPDILFEEFKKWIPHLTLDQTESLTLKNKRDEILEIKVDSMKQQLDEMRGRFFSKEFSIACTMADLLDDPAELKVLLKSKPELRRFLKTQ